MNLKSLINILILFLLINCSGNNNKSINNKFTDFEPPEEQYVNALKLFENQKYEEANLIFKNIERVYPLSKEAIQSQIMQGFADYVLLDYDSAINKFTRVIKKYPSLQNLDYVYYMRALCYYEQISHEGLDGQYNKLALENLNLVINRFPDSKYSKDSYQKIILVKSNIAAKHMDVARFYQKEKKYTAALNRYKIVINSYEQTKFVPEALYRTAEIYLSMGLVKDSKKTAAILGHNYPNSEWYKYIYNELTNKNKGTIFSNSINKILKNE